MGNEQSNNQINNNNAFNKYMQEQIIQQTQNQHSNNTKNRMKNSCGTSILSRYWQTKFRNSPTFFFFHFFNRNIIYMHQRVHKAHNFSFLYKNSIFYFMSSSVTGPKYSKPDSSRPPTPI